MKPSAWAGRDPLAGTAAHPGKGPCGGTVACRLGNFHLLPSAKLPARKISRMIVSSYNALKPLLFSQFRKLITANLHYFTSLK